MHAHKHRSLSILMWILPLSFFTYQFVLRLWPSLMMQQIMHQFSIDATAFGILVSIYYYGYAGMQIPIAIMLDHYGARFIIFFCCIVCGIATFIFSTTENWYLALLSRFLIGAGSAVGFLGTSKIISQWFPKNQYARMIGFTFTIGLMGAVYGGKPVNFLIDTLGYQKVNFLLVAIALGIGVLSYLLLRRPLNSYENQESIKLSSLKNLLSSPIIWLLAFSNLLMVGALEGFADVWGVNYLICAYNFSKSDAAELISFIFIGMLFGGPFLALCSKKFGLFTMISVCGVVMAVAFLCLILSNGSFSWYMLAALLCGVGILCCYQVLIFAVGCDFVKSELLGVTIAFLNCINMLGGSFFHTLIGVAMDIFWSGIVDNEVRQYTLESYNHALMIIPICSLIGATIILSIKMISNHRKSFI